MDNGGREARPDRPRAAAKSWDRQDRRLQAGSRRDQPRAGPCRADDFRQTRRATAMFRRNQAPDRSGIAAGSAARHVVAASWQTTAASVAPAESPPTTSFLGVDAERSRHAGTPIWRPRSHPRPPPGICARAQAGSRRKPGDSRSLPQGWRKAVMGVDTAGDHAAAVKEHEARQQSIAIRGGGHKDDREYRRPAPAARRRSWRSRRLRRAPVP